MIEKGDGAQIIFEGTLKISFGLLDLSTEQKGLAVGEGIDRGDDFLLERCVHDRLELGLGLVVLLLGEKNLGETDFRLERASRGIQALELRKGGLGFGEV